MLTQKQAEGKLTMLSAELVLPANSAGGIFARRSYPAFEGQMKATAGNPEQGSPTLINATARKRTS